MKRSKRVLRLFARQAHYINAAFLVTWAAIPAKFQDALPLPWVVGIAIALIVLGVVGNVIKDKP